MLRTSTLSLSVAMFGFMISAPQMNLVGSAQENQEDASLGSTLGADAKTSSERTLPLSPRRIMNTFDERKT
jgi:hypothetical protein